MTGLIENGITFYAQGWSICGLTWKDIMKGKYGTISRKGFDVRFGYDEILSRSHQSCWVNLPSEILREVLMRIEASEDTWPRRKNVVTCAGVCKTWREIMKEIVKSPQVSGKLTFPTSLKQPGPKGSILQCYIKRSRTMLNHTYYLFMSLNEASSTDHGKFLLAARKWRRPTCTDYIISMNSKHVTEGDSAFVGKLRSDIDNTTFTVYDAQPTSTVAHIAYELNVLGLSRSRRMKCVVDAIPASVVELGGAAPAQTEYVDINFDSIPFCSSSFRSKSGHVNSVQSGQNEGMLVLRNKAPRWHEQLQSWCLNFSERVTGGSVRNFQLVASPFSPDNGVGGDPAEHENVILEFGKAGKDVYTMDYRYPISAFQAFAICLSSFDTNIACE